MYGFGCTWVLGPLGEALWRGAEKGKLPAPDPEAPNSTKYLCTWSPGVTKNHVMHPGLWQPRIVTHGLQTRQ